jgi:hypothetical protein
MSPATLGLKNRYQLSLSSGRQCGANLIFIDFCVSVGAPWVVMTQHPAHNMGDMQNPHDLFLLNMNERLLSDEEAAA